ncbi:unnamed protein product [Caenorhabditis auriculariae]|uniref:Uncharacterized protein n=1 Tax=Caenorhabditis auriculariae TaxID=2777116 RepID=A0A8S1GTK7_9PELO|nr:unnamed protein product [Caenorhabditis auriculariae]
MTVGIAVWIYRFNCYASCGFSMIINPLLLFAIVTEKATKNRIRTYNNVFIIMAISNIVMTVINTSFQPVFILAHRVIYIVFLGPCNELQVYYLVISFSVLTAIIVLKNVKVPVAYAFRYFLVLNKEELTLPSFLWFFAVVALFSIVSLGGTLLVFLSSTNMALINKASTQLTVNTFTGEHFGCLTIVISMKWWLMCLNLVMVLAFLALLIIDRIIVRHIRLVSIHDMSPAYTQTSAITNTLMITAIETIVLLTVPSCVFSVYLFMEIDTGVSSLPMTVGLSWLPILTSVTCFTHINSYWNKVHYVLVSWKRNVSKPQFQFTVTSTTDTMPSIAY